MRGKWVCMGMLVLLALLACQRQGARPTPKTREQKLLYMLGVMMARQKSDFRLTPADLEYVFAGMREQVRQEKRAMDLEITDEVTEMGMRRMLALSAQGKEKSRPFLEQAAREPGVVKTQSGLLFRSLAEGSGPTPTPTDVVKVHYRSLRMDGAELDNSYTRGQPRQFKAGRTLPCISEGVQRMRVGGKARLVCPSDLAFGDVGMGKDVSPGEAVVFEVELLESVPSE